VITPELERAIYKQLTGREMAIPDPSGVAPVRIRDERDLKLGLNRRAADCPHFGALVPGRTAPCSQCRNDGPHVPAGGTPLPVHTCTLHGFCAPIHSTKEDGVKSCQFCPDHPQATAHRERREGMIAAKRAVKQASGNDRVADLLERAREAEKNGTLQVIHRNGAGTTNEIAVSLPDGALSVNMAANGIGDALLGMTAVAGLKRAYPDRHVAYKAPGVAHRWVELFDGGWDQLLHHQPPPLSGGDMPENPLAGDLEINRGYFRHNEDRDGPRWLRYCRNIGSPGPALPTIRDRKRLLEIGKEWAGAVVLAPFSIYPAREWKIANWHSLVSLLKAKGLRVVAVHSENDFHGMDCECHQGMPPATVAGMMLNSLCVIGVDSGPMHLCGALGVRGVVICGQIPGENVFGVWGTIKVLQGYQQRDDCAGEVVESMLAHARTFLDVSERGEAIVAADIPMEPFRSDKLVEAMKTDPDTDAPNWLRRYEVLHHVVRQLAPRTICEIGVRAGYSSWTMLQASPDSSLIGFEADIDSRSGNSHGGFAGAWESAARLCAGHDFRLVLVDSHQVARLPVCDLCYIDGDHTAPGCYADLLLAEKSARWILLDDYDVSNLGVRAAVNRFLEERPALSGQRIDNGSTGLYLIGKQK
jgi:hypothetical protein